MIDKIPFEEMVERLPPGSYVGMPAGLLLDQFGSQVWSAFVGISLDGIDDAKR